MTWLWILISFVTMATGQGNRFTYPEKFEPRDPAQPIGMPKFCSDEGEICFSYSRFSPIGPPNWFNVCQATKCFFGLNQSPVYINPSSAERITGDFPRLGYGKARTSGKLINEGIYPSIEEIKGPRLCGVPGLPNIPYHLTALHAHFRGGERNIGMEHRIGRRDYDGELHIINTQGSTYWSRVHTPFGLVVLAVFLSLSEGEPSSELDKFLDRTALIQRYRYRECRNFEEFPSLRPFWTYFQNICPLEQEGCVNNRCEEFDVAFQPDLLLPSRRDFYYYYGSLTTPPLSESVTWIVFDQPIRITRRQLNLLQSMESRIEGVPISKNGNVRPLQPLNGRTVFANFRL